MKAVAQHVNLTSTMTDIETYQIRIREICPGLRIESASLNREVLLNDVVIINGDFVFRFAKREFGYKDPREEAHVLRLLREYTTLPIPEPFYESPDALAYRFISGETLRRDILTKLTESDQQRMVS